MASRLIDELDSPPPHGLRVSPLTPREREILDLMASGVTSDRELAERLVVSGNTVKYHLKNILAKLQPRNRAQAVAYALRSGLVDAAARRQQGDG